MESQVPKAQKVPRSELDAAFDECGGGRWMVVQSMPTTPWGYELWPLFRTSERGSGISIDMGLPEDW